MHQLQTLVQRNGLMANSFAEPVKSKRLSAHQAFAILASAEAQIAPAQVGTISGLSSSACSG
jgi:hypothetical protein